MTARFPTVYCKHQYHKRKFYSLILVFVATRMNLSVKGLNSLPATPLALSPHPEGLTCTLYMQKTTPGDTDLWQKLIDDNRASNILCLYFSENKTVPDPDVSFLEQCTINIFVGIDYPYVYHHNSLHSGRPSYYSAFPLPKEHFYASSHILLFSVV